MSSSYPTRELLRLDRMQWCVLIFVPTANAALRKSAGEQIEADAVSDFNLVVERAAARPRAWYTEAVVC
jgi:hypothetical protein